MSERDLTAQETTEFRQCSEAGLRLLALDSAASPLQCVEAVETYVDKWHKPKPGILAKLFGGKPDVVQTALALGAVWGDQLSREFGWEWTCHQAEGQDLYCVASKDRSLAIFPTYFLKACLDSPAVDCTATLAFNMVKAGAIPPLPSNGYQNLMDGVHRIVPK
jgi:hypothetical protein